MGSNRAGSLGTRATKKCSIKNCFEHARKESYYIAKVTSYRALFIGFLGLPNKEEPGEKCEASRFLSAEGGIITKVRRKAWMGLHVDFTNIVASLRVAGY